ncbi:MAG: hypothetical protein DI598_09805 [Pseudopedobacter saltans]|uniref:Anti-FecI sigma factor, FecR n=1 Tax=Pseudopedobacter saltans TaxID=151895 RepID=A0A2W5GS28_9SPHI|nr:MAG: hypothetical protein DI598_09805 [Pseudopedobacter saltans]
MDENQFLKLLYKKLSQTAKKEELEQLETLRHSQKEFNNLYTFLVNKNDNEYLGENDVKEGELAYATLFAKMHANGHFEKAPIVPNNPQLIHFNNRTRKIRLFVSSIAAAILVCFFVYGWYSTKNNDNEEWKNSNVVSTKKGSKSFVLLPDGTKVWLNVDSKLTYKEKFNGSTRQVKLIGEAFFDVAKDTKHPFIIHTDDANIKVLGTAFNVKAYDNESNMETLLVRGKIEITFNKIATNKVILHPGERLKILHKTFIKDNTTVTQSGASDSLILERFDLKQKEIQDTLWLRNTISFDSEPLYTVAKKLEKWFGVTIQIKNEQLNDMKFTGKFENQSLYFILSTLKETGKLDYKRRRDTVYLF